MRIAVYSDLHLEVAPFEPPALDVDLVVLAGDIDNGARGVEWAKRAFDKPVLYVAGNHEYYGGEFGEVQGALAEAAAGSVVDMLDCEERHIGGVRFLGCSLWTDYSLAAEDERPGVIERSRRHNPDHAAIRYGDRPFAPEDAIEICRRHRSWLEARLAARHRGPSVVITHFAPHPGSIASGFRNHPANPGFIVPLEPLMGPAVLWVHGHTHTAFDYSVNGTRIVCNPRGYPDEKTGFMAHPVIELPTRAAQHRA
jgi:predicted phosphodiesterase